MFEIFYNFAIIILKNEKALDFSIKRFDYDGLY